MLSQVGTRGSEDCLYLDLWVPQSGSQVSKNLPVMVWIYGGAFLFGSGKGPNLLNNYLYDGEEIASRGKVIVVNFNYRLGPLGFLSTNDTNAPGNYGLWDQHMALTWVKENIAAFGGDPDNICIFGESAGGASAHLQMLSPHSKGLFKRVISQSGSALNPWLLQTTPRHWAEEVAKSVGCPTEDSAALINCLRITDPNAIVMAIKLKIPSSTGTIPVWCDRFSLFPCKALLVGEFFFLPSILVCSICLSICHTIFGHSFQAIYNISKSYGWIPTKLVHTLGVALGRIYSILVKIRI
uniref:Carboxylic ester hydrolase n=1 Tax=Eptatretus burgeri TaxID=7764 RepID=A0A8C4R065_EPTBU